jgi:hypothetical protein
MERDLPEKHTAAGNCVIKRLLLHGMTTGETFLGAAPVGVGRLRNRK